MKKFAAILMTIVMVLSLSLTTFAAFVSSPSNNDAPTIESHETPEGCDAELKVTSYADRYSLSEEEWKLLEDAYKRISGQKDDAKLAEVLKKIAEEKGVNVSDLSISDLFHIGYEDCEEHVLDGHKGYKITLKADTVANLVGVLHFDGENWTIIKILSYDAENGTVTIFTEELGCFAFVVNKYIAPNTGDTSMTFVWLVLAVACSMAVFCVAVPKKKRS